MEFFRKSVIMEPFQYFVRKERAIIYSNEEIALFVELVAEATDPDRIILFGSYAYGSPNDKSDIDLLVIKNGKDITFEDEAELSAAVYYKRKQRRLRTRYDVLFRTERQIRQSVENSGALLDALRKGRVVYERANQEERRAVL